MIALKQIVLAFLCVLGIAMGQIMFKISAMRWRSRDALLDPHVLSIMFLAIGLYALVTLLWIWLLQEVPLARLYPFMALTFVIVPLAGWWLLDERLRPIDSLGMLAICLGVAILASGHKA